MTIGLSFIQAHIIKMPYLNINGYKNKYCTLFGFFNMPLKGVFSFALHLCVDKSFIRLNIKNIQINQCNMYWKFTR